MYQEVWTRSFFKTFSWRLLATLTTMLFVYLFTGEWTIMMAIGGLEAVSKVLIYFFHERLWDKISFGKKSCQPAVLWFTGLPCSGKTTLSNKICEIFEMKGIPVEHLDGDSVRNIFPQTGFSREERDIHVKRVGYLASKLEKNGVFVLASFISPYEESRQFVRNLCSNFVEIYVSTPLQVCEARDVMGLYKKARKGEIQNYKGVSDPYELPAHPEINIDTSQVDINKAAEEIMAYVGKHYIKRKQWRKRKKVSLESTTKQESWVSV